MPKIFGKNVSPIVIYAAGALAAFLVYSELFPAEATSAGSRRRTTRKTTPAAETGPYTKADFEAKFAAFNEPVKDAFRPLVAKAEPVTQQVQVQPLGPTNILSADLTGGEGNWAYTGFAEVDGVRQGLLENGTTSESVFLRSGQRWKSLVVRSIGTESMTVAGPDGKEVTIPVGDKAAEQTPSAGVTAPNGTTAVPPGGALAGPIGGAGQPGAAATDLRVQPDGNAAMDRETRRRLRQERRQQRQQGQGSGY